MRARDLHAHWRALPLRPCDPLLTSGRALILAPHADDESLGCGGLIAELCERGRPPVVLIATDGAGSHPASRDWPPARLRALREAETLAATARLGLPLGNLGFLRLPDTAAPRAGVAFENACTTIATEAIERGCDTLLASWLGDPHCDHEAVQMMARAVARAQGMRLLSYPVWGWLIAPDTEVAAAEPACGFRLDIARHLRRKGEAIREHASQYADLITDDPDGFRLPAALLGIFAQPYETFLEAPHLETPHLETSQP